MSPQLEVLASELLARGLPDVSISLPAEWGLPVPVDGFESHRLYVWAEMVPGYFAQFAESLAADGIDPAEWRSRWDAADVVQFFGWDNGYFHTIMFPALMMAYDERLRLPSALLANEFLQLDGLKFSTSRGHAVWGSALAAAAPADTIRFALAHDRPEFEATSFTFLRFRQLVNNELVQQWQSWLSGLFQRLMDTCGGVLPDTGPVDSDDHFVASVLRIADDCMAAYRAEQFSTRRAVRCACELVRRCRDFTASQARQRSSPQTSARRIAAIAAEAWAAKVLAQLCYPIMPRFGQELWSALGCSGNPRWDDMRPLTPGTRITAGSTFFRTLPEDLEARVTDAARELKSARASG
jgi:methionyl-tRNA synthetase